MVPRQEQLRATFAAFKKNYHQAQANAAPEEAALERLSRLKSTSPSCTNGTSKSGTPGGTEKKERDHQENRRQQSPIRLGARHPRLVSRELFGLAAFENGGGARHDVCGGTGYQGRSRTCTAGTAGGRLSNVALCHEKLLDSPERKEQGPPPGCASCSSPAHVGLGIGGDRG